MTDNRDIEPVEVFAGTIWQAELLKSILEDSGIDAFLRDENLGTLAPWYASPGGAGSVKVIVSSLDVEKASLIVENFVKNINPVDDNVEPQDE